MEFIETKIQLNVISVKERLPSEEEARQGLFGLHIGPDGEMEGTIAFYRPCSGWAKIGKPNDKGEYPLENIDNEVDYWALIPDEFWEVNDES